MTREAAHGGSECQELVDVKSCAGGGAGAGHIIDQNLKVSIPEDEDEIYPGEESGGGDPSPTCYVEEGLLCVFPFVQNGYEHTQVPLVFIWMRFMIMFY